jgi:hypothetical protein
MEIEASDLESSAVGQSAPTQHVSAPFLGGAEQG